MRPHGWRVGGRPHYPAVVQITVSSVKFCLSLTQLVFTHCGVQVRFCNIIVTVSTIVIILGVLGTKFSCLTM